jgi:hypothetical protein
MPEPTIAVVIEKIKGLEALINLKFEQNEKQHEEIIAHQVKTNGNVKRNTNYRYYMSGVVAVLSVIFSLVIKQVMANGGI